MRTRKPPRRHDIGACPCGRVGTVKHQQDWYCDRCAQRVIRKEAAGRRLKDNQGNITTEYDPLYRVASLVAVKYREWCERNGYHWERI